MSRANLALLIAGFSTFVAMGAGQSLYGPVLPVFGRAFGLTLAQAGWLVTAHWVGCAVGVAASYFANRHVTPRLSLGVMAAGAAVIATGAGWWPTLGGALVFGAGYGGATSVFNPRVLHAFGAQGGSMLSLMNAAFSLGAICAPLVFVLVGSDPRISYGVVAVLCAAIAAGVRDDGGDTTTETARGDYRLHLGILGFQAIAIGMEASLIGIGPAALIRAGVAETRAAELLSMFFVAFLAARVTLIFVVHLLPSFAFFAVAMAVAAIASTAASLFSPGMFFVLIGASAGTFFPSGFMTGVRKMGRDSRVTPTLIAAGLVGGILGPILLSSLAEGMGPRGFFQLIAGISIATAVAAILSLRAMNR